MSEETQESQPPTEEEIFEQMEDIETMSLGAVHHELGFKTLEETAEFLRACYFHGMIEIIREREVFETEEDGDATSINLMDTRSLHPIVLRKLVDTRITSRKQLKERQKRLTDSYCSEVAFLSILEGENYEFIFNQIVAIRPLAELVRKGECTVGEYVEDRQKIYKQMIWLSQQPGSGPKILKRIFVFLIMSTLMTIVGFEVDRKFPQFFPDSYDWTRKKLSQVFSSDEEAKKNPDPSEAPVVSPPPTEEKPGDSSREVERAKISGALQTHFGESDPIKAQCEALFQKILDGKQVTTEEIDRLLNPEGQSASKLDTIEKAWNSQENRNEPGREEALTGISYWRQRLQLAEALKRFNRNFGAE